MPASLLGVPRTAPGRKLPNAVPNANSRTQPKAPIQITDKYRLLLPRHHRRASQETTVDMEL